MSKRITIMDIAKATNVTHTTVYKALRNKPYISKETRKRILEAAKSMGYRANKVAQSLVRKNIKIGIIIEGYISTYSNELIRGIKEGLDELIDDKIEGVFSEFEPSHGKEKIIKKITNFTSAGAQGIIFSPYAACDEYAEMIAKLEKKGIPVILVTADIPDSKKLTTIRPDGILVGSIGAELLHLFKSGNNFAVFTGNRNVIHHQEIVDGFTEKTRSLSHKVIGVYETRDDYKTAYHSAELLLNDHPETDGIFVGTSHSAGICKKITELGLEKKITVITTDVFPELAEYIENGIVRATIFQNSFMQGKMAVNEMFRYLTGDSVTGDKVFVNPEILIKSNYKKYMPPAL